MNIHGLPRLPDSERVVAVPIPAGWRMANRGMRLAILAASMDAFYLLIDAPRFGSFIHNEICYDVPHSKKNSYIPVTRSVTLKRGQEILARVWYGRYLAIKGGKPCR